MSGFERRFVTRKRINGVVILVICAALALGGLFVRSLF